MDISFPISFSDFPVDVEHVAGQPRSEHCEMSPADCDMIHFWPKMVCVLLVQQSPPLLYPKSFLLLCVHFNNVKSVHRQDWDMLDRKVSLLRPFKETAYLFTK